MNLYLEKERWPAWIRQLVPTLRYWMETEVHVYAFSVAANVLLSFFPFLIVILTLCRRFLGGDAANMVVDVALGDYFPDQLGSFITRNLKAGYHPKFQIVSLLLLLFTANGVFEPMEVALNRAWGVTKNRSFFRNQIVSLGLIFVCGSLAIISALFTAMPGRFFGTVFLTRLIGVIFFKIAAVPLSIFMLFLIYWLLPNRKVPWQALIAPAVIVGLLLEILKYINLLTWPLLRVKLAREYGPFVYSVTIVLWSFLSAMLVLAGAEWCARRVREKNPAQQPTQVLGDVALPG